MFNYSFKRTLTNEVTDQKTLILIIFDTVMQIVRLFFFSMRTSVFFVPGQSCVMSEQTEVKFLILESVRPATLPPCAGTKNKRSTFGHITIHVSLSHLVKTHSTIDINCPSCYFNSSRQKIMQPLKERGTLGRSAFIFGFFSTLSPSQTNLVKEDGFTLLVLSTLLRLDGAQRAVTKH